MKAPTAYPVLFFQLLCKCEFFVVRSNTIEPICHNHFTTLPFSHLPRRVKIELVYFVVFWLNAFPVGASVSRNYSPWELVLRLKADYKKHCRVLFGSYCEVHDEPEAHKLNDTPDPRSHSAGSVRQPLRYCQVL